MKIFIMPGRRGRYEKTAENHSTVVCATRGHEKLCQKKSKENLGQKCAIDKFYGIVTRLSRRADF